MQQTREAMAQNLAERLCWQAARRDTSQIARRLYRKQVAMASTSWMKGPCWMTSSPSCTRLVGFNAPQVRHGVCQRVAAQRQGPCTRGPICPDALADNIGQLHVGDLEDWFNGGIRALAKAGVLAPKVTGRIDATDLDHSPVRRRWSRDPQAKEHGHARPRPQSHRAWL